MTSARVQTRKRFKSASFLRISLSAKSSIPACLQQAVCAQRSFACKSSLRVGLVPRMGHVRAVGTIIGNVGWGLFQAGANSVVMTTCRQVRPRCSQRCSLIHRVLMISQFDRHKNSVMLCYCFELKVNIAQCAEVRGSTYM